MGGTGLGLAIVKELVEQFGGEIVIESSEHEGNTFRFYFLYIERARPLEKS